MAVSFRFESYPILSTRVHIGSPRLQLAFEEKGDNGNPTNGRLLYVYRESTAKRWLTRTTFGVECRLPSCPYTHSASTTSEGEPCQRSQTSYNDWQCTHASKLERPRTKSRRLWLTRKALPLTFFCDHHHRSTTHVLTCLPYVNIDGRRRLLTLLVVSTDANEPHVMYSWKTCRPFRAVQGRKVKLGRRGDEQNNP
ncbi:hypothetical protein M404DRAFT_714297 [Pisolithus tinctorius Marx 270]|uniref:Uncharacterized protein n=1 Tax=Pisolithus tinctorius Marx 270 TaxID=870435 RepID=A0A0C3P4G1_PISTI|nr:hypothetical protein M404DRAFT_714297 [Pisolithus tinctorius Marx 270]